MNKHTLHVTLLTLALTMGFSVISRADYTWHTYEGHQYALTQNRGTWTANEAEAVAAGGHLVTINNVAEETWLKNTFGTTRLWIGFNQIPDSTEPGGGWVWSSGEEVTYVHWTPGEPNDAPHGDLSGSEDKAVMNWDQTTGAWNDLNDNTDESSGYGIIERRAAVPIPSFILLQD